MRCSPKGCAIQARACTGTFCNYLLRYYFRELVVAYRYVVCLQGFSCTPRSQQPWSPEPLAGNFNQCAQLSAVIVKANTNAESPNTRAALFHLGKLIPPKNVPETYGFNDIDNSQCTGDTVALMYSGGIGLPSIVKSRWNGNEVELVTIAER